MNYLVRKTEEDSPQQELNNNIMKIAILGYDEGKVLIKEVPRDLEELDNEDIAANMGLKVADTEYMVIEDVLPVTIITKDCCIDVTLK